MPGSYRPVASAATSEISPSTGGAAAVALPAPIAVPTASDSGADFAALFRDLKKRVRAAGLLERRPARYIWTAIWIAAGLAAAVALMVAYGSSVPVQAFNGALLAFVYTQIGFVMHDAGHRQVFRSPAANDRLGMVCANLLIGLSFDWWCDKHNRHHTHPNQEDHDPDIDFPVVAFSEKQALEKPRPWSWIVRYQAILFIPLLLLEGMNLRANAIEHLVRGRAKRPWLEGSLLAVFFVTYIGLIVAFLEPGPAIAFLIVNQGLSGLYTGAVFAPNHKGMPVLESDHPGSFLERQVLTSRNVRGTRVADFMYGGLNYQIEHHLFPGLPRFRLRAARRVVRPFLRERGIPYAETGVARSFGEILGHLHRVSRPLRRGRRRAGSESTGGMGPRGEKGDV